MSKGKILEAQALVKQDKLKEAIALLKEVDHPKANYWISQVQSRIKNRQIIQKPEYKECPYCAEKILAKATLCRYCGSNFEEIARQKRIKQEIKSIKTLINLTSLEYAKLDADRDTLLTSQVRWSYYGEQWILAFLALGAGLIFHGIFFVLSVGLFAISYWSRSKANEFKLERNSVLAEMDLVKGELLELEDRLRRVGQ